ncbi:hypothetical protein BGZ82_003713 [Podila clonocystis]|nr:hypothetical protein BGZ82_003713 [Podila clonocystis]
MVKLSLAFLSVATAFAVASAAPYSLDPNECIPETNIKEYHPFLLKSYGLDILLSKHINSNLLVSGFPSRSKYFQELEFCIVSTDDECTTDIAANCIYEGVEYRFRVNNPIQGYLSIEDEQVRIVPDFKDASGLNLYRGADGGMHVAHRNPDGSRSVFETGTPGRAVVVTELELHNYKQWFQIIA